VCLSFASRSLPPYVALTISTISRGGLKINVSSCMKKTWFLTLTPVEKWFTRTCFLPSLLSWTELYNYFTHSSFGQSSGWLSKLLPKRRKLCLVGHSSLLTRSPKCVQYQIKLTQCYCCQQIMEDSFVKSRLLTEHTALIIISIICALDRFVPTSQQLQNLSQEKEDFAWPES